MDKNLLKKIDEEKERVNIEAAASILNISSATIRNWIKANYLIPYLYKNKKYVFYKEEILTPLPEEEKQQFENPEELVAVYLFNKYEYVLATFLSSGKIDKEKYLQVRNEYISRNKYLALFDISAPRNFGETWAQNFLQEKVPEIMSPTKKNDSNYSGAFEKYWQKR